MTHALLYPPANHTSQWFADKYPGTVFTSMEKLLLHTTEGSGWPDYSGGAIAPNMTGYPDAAAQIIRWRQHWPVNQSSRALQHTQTQPTNGDHVFQVELIGTCVPNGPGLYWPEAPDWALQSIADLLAWLNAEWGVSMAASVSWRAYNASGDGQRLSNDAYDAYRGVLGHEHAPQNDHRDPGALNVPRVIQLAQGGTVSDTQPTLGEIQGGILYYRLDDAHVNPLTMITRTYDAVSALTNVLAGLVSTETDESKRVLAIQGLLSGMADQVAAKVVAALPSTGSGPSGGLTQADVEAAVKAALREGAGTV